MLLKIPAQDYKSVFYLFILSIWMQPCAVADINRTWLRKDETLGFDQITFEFSATATEASDPRTFGLAFDSIRFLNAEQQELLRIDIGARPDRYYLGGGWYSNELWGESTVCWTDGKAPFSSVYCRIPRDASILEVTCLTPNTNIVTNVTINGTTIGTLDLPARSGWRILQLPIEQELDDHLEYRLTGGGTLNVAGVDWLDSSGGVITSNYTLCTLQEVDNPATFPLQIPHGATDFALRLQSTSIVESTICVTVNAASSLILVIPAGADYVPSTEENALERQADHKTQTDGWGDDFNARNAVLIEPWEGWERPQLACDGDALTATGTDETRTGFALKVDFGEPVSVSTYKYLSLKIRATAQTQYYIRPDGNDAAGTQCPLWYEEAVTDDRVGTGEWEILTISLPRLISEATSPATSISSVYLILGRNNLTTVSLSLDWMRIHKGFLPNENDVSSSEAVFDNHLDDDGDGLVDTDDRDDYTLSGFTRRLIFGLYHPWYGTPFGTTGTWSGWAGEQVDTSDPDNPPVSTGVVYDPDTYDPQWSGKRNLSSAYYPLDFAAYPDYNPPVDGAYRYDLYGGVESYDNLSREYLSKELAFAAQYGIDGFVVDSGGAAQSTFAAQIQTMLTVSSETTPSFRVSALYDWYYQYPAFGLMSEKNDYQMAFDLKYFYFMFGMHPQWWLLNGRPVICPIFRADTIALDKWKRVSDIFVQPEISPYDGTIALPRRYGGFENTIAFEFSAVDRDGADTRWLSVAIDYISCLDHDLLPISSIDMGTSAARPHLLFGWGGDETWGGNETMVWAEGLDRYASLEIEIPIAAKYLALRCLSFPESNDIALSMNGSATVTCSISQQTKVLLFRIEDSGTEVNTVARSSQVGNNASKAKGWPIALFLDSRKLAHYFEGFASYVPFLRSSRCIVSEAQPVICTVGCGYDDRKIRLPGSCVDREDGNLYRREWETALGCEPDVVFINTWNEWLEGTNISPSVEFGYKYLEITLTYSLVFRKLLSTSVEPSEMGLTVSRYNLEEKGPIDISFEATAQGTLIWNQLPIAGMWHVLADGEEYRGVEVNPSDQSLIITTRHIRTQYQIISECEGEGGGEGDGEGEGEGEGTAEGEGSTVGEGTAEGEGSTEGEGTAEGEGPTEGEGSTEGEGAAEGEDLPVTKHSADQNADAVISLTELLRVIQFFNSGGLYCVTAPATSEDGYLPGSGEYQSCPAHASDYNPQNWQISLAELLRLIQFFNSGGYHYCPGEGTEDGFCPGPA